MVRRDEGQPFWSWRRIQLGLLIAPVVLGMLTLGSQMVGKWSEHNQREDRVKGVDAYNAGDPLRAFHLLGSVLQSEIREREATLIYAKSASAIGEYYECWAASVVLLAAYGGDSDAALLKDECESELEGARYLEGNNSKGSNLARPSAVEREASNDNFGDVSLRLVEGALVHGEVMEWSGYFLKLRTQWGEDKFFFRDRFYQVFPLRDEGLLKAFWKSLGKNNVAVSWSYDSFDGPVERIEGCHELLQGPSQGWGIVAVCRGVTRSEQVNIPSETFAIKRWTLQPRGKDSLLIIEPRRGQGGGFAGQRRVQIEVVLPSGAFPATPVSERQPPFPLTVADGTDSRDWPTVYRSLREKVRQEPQDLSLQLLFVEACFETQRFAEAKEKLGRLLEAQPQRKEFLYWRGVLAINDGDFHTARGILEGVRVHVEEQTPEVHLYLGMAYLFTGTSDLGCGELDAYRRRVKRSEYLEIAEEVADEYC